MSQDPIACSCITCSDQAVDVTVTALEADGGLARCIAADGSEAEIDVSLVDGVQVGTHVLVHAGIAIALTPEVQLIEVGA